MRPYNRTFTDSPPKRRPAAKKKAKRRSISGPRGTLQPDPGQLRRHAKVSGALREGVALATGVPVNQIVACAGAARIRIRFKATAAGALALRFVRPNNLDTEYEQNQPADVAVVANTETKLDVAEHMGEGLALLRYTPSGNGVVTYCDIMNV